MMRALLLMFVFAGSAVSAKTVRYELTATKVPVNLSGKKTVDFALMMNGQIPSPTLEFTEGDEAEIVVKNGMDKEELSQHWHGILLPPLMDGVAYVNTPPIRPGESFTFKFKVRQHGTYWYHSHTGVQEQKGLYGAIVIHPKNPTIKADKEVVAVISDWSDENADQIMKNLRKDGDYYLYKKGTVRSLVGAARAGGLGTYLHNEWTRMGGMDLSDVGYDAFLINGKRDLQLGVAHPGETVRLRIINAAASSYFYFSLGQEPMKVISADGIDIEPVMAKDVLIGMAETYDVLFKVPEHKNYELRVTAQDGTGSASGWIGMGEKVPAPVRPMPDMYAPMDHGGHADHGAHGSHSDHSAHAQHPPAKTAQPADSHHGHHAHHHGHHGHHAGHKAKAKTAAKEIESKPLRQVESLSVDELRSPVKTAFAANAKIHTVKLVLGGDMERYVWHINGKAIHQDRTIKINEGDVVRFTFENETMMHHPMHFHGHFFRVLNQGGDFSPLKHTVDVPPHGSRTIEFLADEPGDWMLHCHNLYHMKTGMARVVEYSTFVRSPEIAHFQKLDPHLHDHLYYDGMIEGATNHAKAKLRLSKTWDTLEAKLEAREEEGGIWEPEADLFYRRWFGQYLNLVAGGTSFKEKQHAVAGVGYKLPMLIESTLLVNHEGKFRLDLEKHFQWTKYIFTEAEVSFRQDFKTEFEVSLMYANSWKWSAGLMLTEHKLGAGVVYKF